MAFYEFTTIIRPDVPTTTVDAISNKVADLVKKHKGKVVKTEQWGLRTLAYAMNKHRKGYYTLHGLQLNDGAAVTELEHAMKLSDDVIRFLTVKVDEISKEPSAILKAKARAEENDMGMPSSMPAGL
jgi:small subunit ribosomal protein S6